MQLPNWLARFVNVVNAEYERRIKRASNITDDNTHHAQPVEEEEGEVAEIVNVPRGTHVPRPNP